MRAGQGRVKHQESCWGGNVAVVDQLSIHHRGWHLSSPTPLGESQPRSRSRASTGMPPTNPSPHSKEASEVTGGKGETLWPGQVGLGN